MSNKAQYILYSLLDIVFTFGGTVGVIIYNYISPNNSTGFKITLSGIILVIVLIFTAKYMFEKSYRQKYDTLLQQLAEAKDEYIKDGISEVLNNLKMRNYIYQRLIVLMPFAILYVVTWLGATSLESLHGTVGLILSSMGAGSIFNVLKKPAKEKASLDKISSKAKKE